MLGLLYDVHGNLPALEAVLDDASDVDTWLLGGDYTLFGAWPVGHAGSPTRAGRHLDPWQR